jgi:lipoprotein-anchoring transpeptidase ErfK/SrfK
MDELRVHEPWRFRHEEEQDAAVEPAEATGDPPTPAATTSTRRDRSATTAASAAGTSENPEATPSGEPRLRDLRGERGGPVIRRLLTGMYVALDRTVRNREDGDRYWRTQSGGFVRTGLLSIVHDIPTFQGVQLDAAHTLPYAFMVSLHGWSYRITPNGRAATSHRRIPRLTALALTGDPPVEIGTQRYWRTTDGFAVNERNVRIATLRPPPEGTGPEEKWIDVDLDEQVLVAYEGARPVYVTLVSTGRRSDSDPDRNYETPAGAFRIRGKHISTTMDGDTAADGPYSIEDVPWAMYFHDAYALHGAFWHGNFGWRMSHGCVNLSPLDARWIFFWSEPQLPEGWHGVFASADRPGTRIELHHHNRPTPRVPTR